MAWRRVGPSASPPIEVDSSLSVLSAGSHVGNGLNGSANSSPSPPRSRNSGEVMREDTDVHKTMQDSAALFRCTLCDEGEVGVAARFETYGDVAGHVRDVHKVAAEAVNQVIKLPAVEALRAYQCVLCGEAFVGTTEERVAKDHLMGQHNAKKVKSSQIRRMCRVCGFNQAKTDAQLVQHINDKHPKSDFADDDSDDDVIFGGSGDDDDGVGENAINASGGGVDHNNANAWGDATVAIKTTPQLAPVQQSNPSGMLFPSAYTGMSGVAATADGLKSHSISYPMNMMMMPAPVPPSKWEVEETEVQPEKPKTAVTKKGGKASKAKKRRGAQKDKSDSSDSESSSSSSAGNAKKIKKIKKKKLKKKKKRKYRKPSGSSSNDTTTQEELERLLEAKNILEAEIKKANAGVSHEQRQTVTQPTPPALEETALPKRSPVHSRSPTPEERFPTTRRVVQSRSRSKTRSRSPTPPPRSPEHYCSDCRGYFTDSTAYDHFRSSSHRESIRSKVRCFLCCLHVSDLKAHFERFHTRDVFQCQMPKCSNPKFLDIVKIVKHIRDKHFNISFNRTDDLIRNGQITIPQNLASYRCRRCKELFLGQSLDRVLDHQRWQDGARHPSEDDVEIHCRVCGPRRSFDDDRALQRHMKTHVPDMVWSPSPPPGRRSPSPPPRRRDNDNGAARSRSRTRSRSPGRRGLSAQSSGSRKRRDYVPCPFCPCVTEDFETDKMNHYSSNHEQHLFRCRLCQGKFASPTRFGVFAHLRKMHRKEESDENLTRRHIILPNDIRRVYCHTCYQNEEVVEWCCQPLRELESVVVEHRNKKHGDASIGDVIRLGCRACDAFYGYGDLHARKEWHNHVKFGHRGGSADEYEHQAAGGSWKDNRRRSRSRNSDGYRSRS